MSGIGQLLKALAAVLPFKVVVALGVAIAVIGAPFWVESIRDRQIRGAVRQMVRAEPEVREQLVQRVYTLCGDKPRRLTALVETAIKYDQRTLRDEALVKLESAGGKADAARFRKALAPERTTYRNALEAAIRIERLYKNGLVEKGDEQLALALAAFPDDPDLAAIQRPAAPDATEPEA